jgi:hypothetical protein
MIKHTLTFAFVIALAIFILPGCKNETPSSTGGSSAKAPKDADTHAHDDGTVHTDDHAEPAGGAGHGGAIIELGTATIGPFSVRASRDQGEIKAGGDVPIDVWLTGGDISKVTAVRFWIGTEQGDQFVKAKANIEIPSEPNHWHTHAAVPNPIPAGSKLWVEIETAEGKQVGSFDLKT